MNIIREVDDSICDNKLVPYWTGINIIGVNTDKPAVNYKVYYQLRCPLFLNDAFDKESICKLIFLDYLVMMNLYFVMLLQSQLHLIVNEQHLRFELVIIIIKAHLLT